ncbi:MFS general substrate transporter [Basidiobolus meristosporus CBS 931.73]|uniref:MFS general substrate transporter n=1 Tax=Basidiobolus meristosporus CBS 931.73 TaxID=1314790 RepID=A0A1Y1XX20_9FUNG|nr:MFS general substrate transporter [Basidiobolus meristosporus CBS 931.73]|eukprot:ORX90282.1 MFS general substrate transporter [Basidiobolus meristosporus CBS 931.73]
MSDFKSEYSTVNSKPTSEEVAYHSRRKSRISALFTVIFSGFALLSDGYQSGVISFVNLVLTKLHPTEYTSEISARISNALFVGMIIGQLGFGLVCDRIGRKVGMMSTTALVIIGAILSAVSYGAGGSVSGLFWMLTICRGILGVGVGGEYPCSSVSASESADEVRPNNRGCLFVMVTAFVIDFGYVLSALVPIILLAIFHENLEAIWRIALGLGAIPPLSVFYFRMKMNNSARYESDGIKRNVPYILIFKRYWPRILTTAGLWFFYDFISYPSGVFSSTILSKAVPDDSLMKITSWNLLLYSFYLPGVVGGAIFSDKIGRKRTMAIGFALQGIVGIAIGVAYKPLIENAFPLFVVLYGIYLAFGEFGPGDCIGLISAESYPTAVRGTAYGISAAIGKVGASVGTAAFKPIVDAFGGPNTTNGQRSPFIIGCCLALLGAILTWFFVPNLSKDCLEEEDEAFKEYLAQNGYDVRNIGAPNRTKTAISHDSA